MVVTQDKGRFAEGDDVLAFGRCQGRIEAGGGSARGPHRQEIDEEGGGAAMGDGSRCAGLASQPGEGLRPFGYGLDKGLGMQRRTCEFVVYAAEVCQRNVHASPVWFTVIGDTIYALKSSHGARAECG